MLKKKIVYLNLCFIIKTVSDLIISPLLTKQNQNALPLFLEVSIHISCNEAS